MTRLRDDAVLPKGAYPGDAGLDLVACEQVVLEPGERAVVPTGVAVAIPEGHAGLVSRAPALPSSMGSRSSIRRASSTPGYRGSSG